MTARTRLLSTGQTAARLGVTNVTVLEWVKAGRIVPDQKTPGGHYRFLDEEVSRLENSLRGEIQPSDEGHQPFDFKPWLLGGIIPKIREWFRRTDLNKGEQNSIHLTITFADEEIGISSTHESEEHCPYRSIKRHGDLGVVLSVGFENPPSFGQIIECVMDFLNQILDTIFFPLQSAGDPVYSSSHFVVRRLRSDGWFLIRVRDSEFLLVLPRSPSPHEWNRYGVKCLVHYQATRGMLSAPVPFFFKAESSNVKEENVI